MSAMAWARSTLNAWKLRGRQVRAVGFQCLQLETWRCMFHIGIGLHRFTLVTSICFAAAESGSMGSGWWHHLLPLDQT